MKITTCSRMLILPLLAAGQAIGQSHEEAVHEFLIDPVEVWLSRLMLWTSLLAIAAVLFSLFKYRGRPAGRAAWSIIIASVVVLPVMSFAFSGLLVVERAEEDEFCASCHLTMQVYYDDMVDPESESLAALHYKNRYIPKHRCYQCHTSYGMFGTVQAKLKGLNDVYKYYTRTFVLPIEMHEPYPNGDCLKCHAESHKWMEQEMHVDSKDALFADEAKCQDCHEAFGHPAHILPEVASTEAD